jgi:hypothetical protein
MVSRMNVVADALQEEYTRVKSIWLCRRYAMQAKYTRVKSIQLGRGHAVQSAPEVPYIRDKCRYKH